MRKANVSDLFNVARLVKNFGIKDEVFDAAKGKDDLEEIGFEMIYNIFDKATTEESEKQIYEVLSKPFEISSDEVSKMEIDVLIQTFKTCFNMETLVNFIKRVPSKAQ